jgi:hypothetical protein
MNAIRVTTEVIQHDINRHIAAQITAANEAIAGQPSLNAVALA